MRPTTLIALLYGFSVLLSHSAAPKFPLQVSENRRHLVDQGGVPFLYNADTPWMLFTHLLPDLRQAGFDESEIQQFTIRNPAEAFTIRVR